MLTHAAAYLAAKAANAYALDPTPTPTGAGDLPGGFDWSRIGPDPKQVPRSDLFYSLINGALFLGVAAALTGLIGGAIVFGIGPVFGAHILSDRGKTMMWKASLVAIIIGSPVAIISFFLKQ
ncbi:hypothetical protein [Dactylosporangium darangshiense]|uniref:DUF4190 domain-containing protein n=1 Tax=Dactylosporangium darangshiense TaxID=579108 RepID=A0ABP8DN76_9ACTN